jgi:prepilin-type processing-associated H-X9-DG protein
MTNVPRRLGFTLIEIIVVIMTIGILSLLLLRAVQSARNSSQKLACSVNLRQIGLAVMQYESAQGTLPPSRIGIGYSWFVAILPHLDQATLYNATNIQTESQTLTKVVLNTLLCPADTVELTPGIPTSYAGNFGSGVQKYGYDGLFQLKGSFRISQITDGLSTTSLATEWLPGMRDNPMLRDPARSIYRTNKRLIQPEEFDDFVRECQNLEVSKAQTGLVLGRPWTHGHIGHSQYNHTTRPFENRCINGGAVQEGAYPPSSLHGDIINLLYADGHVGQIKRSISMSVWRALGTRQGQDTVSY